MPPIYQPSPSRFLPFDQTAAWRTPPPRHQQQQQQLLQTDDPYLLALATTDFSSPSLPPLSLPSSPPPPPPPLTTATRPFEPPKPFGTHNTMPYAPTRRTSRVAARTGGGIVDLTKEETEPDDAVSIIGDAPASLPMPSVPRQASVPAAVVATNSTSGSLRKRRASITQPATPRPAKSRKSQGGDADPFASEDDSNLSATKSSDEAGDSIDLSNATEVPKELLVPKADNRVKLGKFQCVICMDDVTALTVTHCGHLFCSECLHSALHIDSSKKTCPVCRTKVDMKNAKSKTTKTYYHLELKLMTTRKQGKRPAG